MRNGLSRIRDLMLHRLSSLCARSLQATAVHEDTADLDDTNASQEEVDGGEATHVLDVSFMKGVFEVKAYRTFRGVMIIHQRVQMAPVAMRAPFCVRESFSAGRWKSEIPAMTRPHCASLAIPSIQRVLYQLSQNPARVTSVVAHTFITGALHNHN